MARPGAACPPPARRVMVAARALLFWALVYSYCGLCACIAGLRLLWSIGRRPGETFRWVVRENPPACLNDPSLGTHCYVRIKVRARAGAAGAAPLRASPRCTAPCVCRAPCVLSYACVCAATRACLPLHARTPARIHVPACASPGKRSCARPGSLGSAGRGRRPGPAATGEVVPGGLGFGERVKRSPALGVPHPACGTCPSLPCRALPVVYGLLSCTWEPLSCIRLAGKTSSKNRSPVSKVCTVKTTSQFLYASQISTCDLLLYLML